MLVVPHQVIMTAYVAFQIPETKGVSIEDVMKLWDTCGPSLGCQKHFDSLHAPLLTSQVVLPRRPPTHTRRDAAGTCPPAY